MGSKTTPKAFTHGYDRLRPMTWGSCFGLKRRPIPGKKIRPPGTHHASAFLVSLSEALLIDFADVCVRVLRSTRCAPDTRGSSLLVLEERHDFVERQGCAFLV